MILYKSIVAGDKEGFAVCGKEGFAVSGKEGFAPSEAFLENHRFGNEWVGNVVGSVNKSLSETDENPSRKIIAITEANLPFSAPQGIAAVQVCDLFDNEDEVFPSILPAITENELQNQKNQVRKLFQLIPNPAKSEVTLSFFLPEKEEGTVILTDMFGKKEISNYEVIGSGVKNSITLNISGLSQGVYYTKLSTKTGWTSTLKLVVIR